MRKLLNIISSTALVGTSTLAVISCSSNKKFNEFKGWINNKESFILYMGADDCPHCKDFDNAKKDYSDKFDSKMNELNTSYEQKVVNQGANYPDSMTAYGEKLNNKVDFREFKTEEVQNKFNEKWSKNILDWMIEEVTEIYKTKVFGNTGINDKIAYNESKKKVKTYFNNNNGVPMFIIIRNGKLVSWEVGFGSSEQGWTEKIIDELFEPLITAMNNSDQETVFIDKVDKGQSTGGGEAPDPEGPDPTDPGTDPTNPGEEVANTYKFNYLFEQDDLINSYSVNSLKNK